MQRIIARREKTTTLMLFAPEIIKRTKFKFDIIFEKNWDYGYNNKIMDS